MALYVFVATPVQLWHHHNYSSATTSGSTDKKESASFSKSNGKTSDVNCQVCSHQYSTYNEGTVVAFAAAIFISTTKVGFYHSYIPSSPLFNFSNKGPPALA